MQNIHSRRWSPYAVGVGIGILSWFAFATAGQGLGITSPFEHTMALLGRALAPGSEALASYSRAEQPRIGWEWMLVIGVFLGSVLSSKLSGDRVRERIPSLWRERFGASPWKRGIAAFAGGALMMFGARLAKGCTSGHGITGTLQLAISSWIFIVLAFATGVVTALTLYGFHNREAQHVR
jgi:uncharacterized protein